MKTDYMSIDITIDQGVAVFCLNNPPVNQLSAGLREDMAQAFKAAREDASVSAIVLTGTGKNFMAGADITEIQYADDADLLYENVLAFDAFYNSIENSSKPVIAAVNGPALGGGLELAMACHFRIGAENIILGQPEIQLGLIPGAGGTQRLPRLCGLADALTLITTGAPLKAKTALEKGILDQVVPAEELRVAAVKKALEFIASGENLDEHRTRCRKDRLPNEEEKAGIISFAKDAAQKKAKGMPAPLKAIEAMEKGLTHDFNADIKREARLFSQCAVSDIAENLIALFLNSRSAGRLPQLKNIVPAPIKTVAMVGLGVMGSGIANLLLRNGYRAILWEKDDIALTHGMHAVRKTFAFPIKKGKMTEIELDMLVEKNALLTTEINDLATADLVIEAVVENMEVKTALWQQIDKVCDDQAVFATNTSALPITKLADCLKNPSRMLGLHFFNPAERMQLLEIINARETSVKALATGVAFARRIKKIPVVVNDGPGFYVSRQLNALMGECNYMLEEGIPIPLVDQAMTGMGLPMGPCILNDLTGIDIGYHVAQNFEHAFGDRWQMADLHHRIYETGCYGRKTGAGYYEYKNGCRPVPNPRVTSVIDTFMAENGVALQAPKPDVLSRRMLARAINEAAYMMEEGICDRAHEMDLAMVYGCGYPPYRGGILREADAWGIKNVCTTLAELEAEHGIRFTPSKLLVSMAEQGQTFYDG